MTAFAWMIEAPGPRYLAVQALTRLHRFHWSADPYNGIRFVSSEQAALVMMSVRDLAPELFEFAKLLGEARPVEHGWMAPREVASARNP